jgi:predicted Zn finger-like uncharacterized protein
MRLTCPTCETAYEVPAGQIPDEGRHVQCSACHTRWFAHRPVEPEPSEDQIIYRLETRSARHARPEASATVPDAAAEPAPRPAPTPPPAFEPPQTEGDFLWETASPSGTAAFEPLRKPGRDLPRSPTPMPTPAPTPIPPAAPPRPEPQAAPEDLAPEPPVEVPSPAPSSAPSADADESPVEALLAARDNAQVPREQSIEPPLPAPQDSPMQAAPLPVATGPAAREPAIAVPPSMPRKDPGPPADIVREPPREGLRPGALDLRRGELAPPPPRPAEVPLARGLPAATEVATAAPGRPGHHLRLDVTDAQATAGEAQERLAPRRRFGRGVFVALLLSAAALGLYLFGGRLAAMTPALAPAIEAYVGAVDRLREAMLPGVGSSFWPAFDRWLDFS